MDNSLPFWLHLPTLALLLTLTVFPPCCHPHPPPPTHTPLWLEQVKWPPTVKQFLQYLSVFNFNIDLTAPECSIPDVSFANKWQFTMAIPAVAVTFFVVAHCLLYVLVCRGRRFGPLFLKQLRFGLSGGVSQSRSQHSLVAHATLCRLL